MGDFGSAFPASPFPGQRFSKDGVYYVYQMGAWTVWQPAVAAAPSGGSAPTWEFFEPFEVSTMTAVNDSTSSPALGGGTFLPDLTTPAIRFTSGPAADGGTPSQLTIDIPAVPSGYDTFLVEIDASLLVESSSATAEAGFTIYSNDLQGQDYEVPFVDTPITTSSPMSSVMARLTGLLAPGKTTFTWWYGATKASIAAGAQGQLQIESSIRVRPYKLVNGQAL